MPGLTARDMNVVGCASLIAEMVLLFEWDIEDDDMEGGLAVLRDMQSRRPGRPSGVRDARQPRDLQQGLLGRSGVASTTSRTCGCARCDAIWSSSSAPLDGRPS